VNSSESAQHMNTFIPEINLAEDCHQNLESAILLMISVVKFAVRFGFGLMRISTRA